MKAPEQQQIQDLSDPNPAIRKVALEDLLQSDNPEKVKILESRMKEESNLHLRYEIKRALEGLKGIRPKRVSVRKDKVEESRNLEKRLEGAFASQDKEIRNRAFLFAVKHRQIRFLDRMLDLESKHRDPFMKICNLRLLIQMDSPDLNRIISYLEDSDPRVVCSCIEALYLLQNTQTLAAICSVIDHGQDVVQTKVLNILKSLSGERLTHLLNKMAESSHEVYRNSAEKVCRGLALHGATDLLEHLKVNSSQSLKTIIEESPKSNPQDKGGGTPTPSSPAGGDKTPGSRSVADNPLTQSSGLDFMQQFLNENSNPKVIATAIGAFATLDIPLGEKRELLTKFSRHPNARVRANAVEALSVIIPPQHRKNFEEYLKDHNNRVVGNAIMALSAHPEYEFRFHRRAMQSLQNLTQAPGENFRLSALYCIANIRHEDFLPILKSILDENSGRVYERSLQVLEHWAESSQAARLLFEEVEKNLEDFDSSNLPPAESILDQAQSSELPRQDMEILNDHFEEETMQTNEGSKTVSDGDQSPDSFEEPEREDQSNEEAEEQPSSQVESPSVKSKPDSIGTPSKGKDKRKQDNIRLGFEPPSNTSAQIFTAMAIAFAGGGFAGMIYGLMSTQISSRLYFLAALFLVGGTAGYSAKIGCKKLSEERHLHHIMGLLAGIFSFWLAWAGPMLYSGLSTISIFNPIEILGFISQQANRGTWGTTYSPVIAWGFYIFEFILIAGGALIAVHPDEDEDIN